MTNKSNRINKSNRSVVKPVGPAKIPEKFAQVAENCTEILEWDVDKKVGEGTRGKVFGVCRAGNCEYTMKVQGLVKGHSNKIFRKEVRALAELQGTGIVPKLYASWTCDGNGYIIMEKLERCRIPNTSGKRKKFVDKVLNILKVSHTNGWLHNDMHMGNIMCKRGKIFLIDYGGPAIHRNNIDDNLNWYALCQKDNIDFVNKFYTRLKIPLTDADLAHMHNYNKRYHDRMFRYYQKS